MANRLVIKRGSTVIADGITALVEGCPLSDCEHELDFVNLIRGASTLVYDRLTKKGSITFRISRQFGTLAAALHHAFMEPGVTTGRFDFAAQFNDGSSTHVWTLADAGWASAKIESVTGVRVVTSYTVSGGRFDYSGGSLSEPYTDGIS